MAKKKGGQGDWPKYTREQAMADCVEDLRVARERLKKGYRCQSTLDLTQACVMLRDQAMRIAMGEMP